MDKQYHTDELLAEFLPTGTLPVSPSSPTPAEGDEDMKIVADEVAESPAVEEEEDVKIFVPATAAPVEAVSAETKTMAAIGAPLDDEPEEKTEEPVSDQLCFEEWDEAGKREERARLEKEEREAELEENLKHRRREKIRAFDDDRRLKLTGEEEALPVEETEEVLEEEFEEEYVEDFCDYEDAEAVSSELRYRRARHRIGTFATACIEAIALLNVLCFVLGIFHDPLVYIVDSVLILGVMMVLNRALLQDAWEDFRAGNWSGDFAVLLSCTVAVVHTVVQLFHVDTVISNGLLPALAGAGLTLAAMGKQLQLRRLCGNFAFVGKEEDKYVAHRVEDEAAALEIGHSAVAVGQPELAYFTSVPFLHRFLDRSYARRAETPLLKMYIPAVALVAALIAVVYGFAAKQPWQAVYLFALNLCIALPVALPFSFAATFWKASRYALNNGAMVLGRDEADTFGNLNAVCVDAADLFSEDAVLLAGIKTFAGTRIDEAILDAAAVVIAAGGPLEGVFRRVIQDKVDLLQEVDTLVYEQEMGLSGWVGGRRVLVGNRRLLENHGVDVPSRDYEMRYTRAGRKLVYLSTAGQLSAMFVVSYTADASTKRALRALCREDVTLLVRTCDQNVTEELICETFDLPSYYVEILGSAGRRGYEQLLKDAPETDDEEAPALACDGTAMGKAAALTACSRLRGALPLSAFAVLAMGLLGFVLTTLLAFATHTLPSTLTAVLYMAVTAVVGLLVPKVKRL